MYLLLLEFIVNKKIIECKVVGDEFYFKLNGNFEGGEENYLLHEQNVR